MFLLNVYTYFLTGCEYSLLYERISKGVHFFCLWFLLVREVLKTQQRKKQRIILEPGQPFLEAT